MSKEELRLALRSYPGVIQRGNFTLRSGVKSDLYLDIKTAYGDPRLLTLICDTIYSIMDKNTRIVGALHGIGGEPLASALSALYGFNLSIIRPDKKIYGLQKAIEGFSPGKGEEITLVDDVFSSGSSFLDAAKIMDEINGVKVKECCVLVKRNENPNFPFPLKHVFTIDDFLSF